MYILLESIALRTSNPYNFSASPVASIWDWRILPPEIDWKPHLPYPTLRTTFGKCYISKNPKIMKYVLGFDFRGLALGSGCRLERKV
jgi:hypothetical protein